MSSWPPENGWLWPSWIPGMIVAPRASIASVAGPASARASASEPTAINLPPATATAVAPRIEPSIESTLPPVITVSAVGDPNWASPSAGLISPALPARKAPRWSSARLEIGRRPGMPVRAEGSVTSGAFSQG